MSTEALSLHSNARGVHAGLKKSERLNFVVDANKETGRRKTRTRKEHRN